MRRLGLATPLPSGLSAAVQPSSSGSPRTRPRQQLGGSGSGARTSRLVADISTQVAVRPAVCRRPPGPGGLLPNVALPGFQIKSEDRWKPFLRQPGRAAARQAKVLRAANQPAAPGKA